MAPPHTPARLGSGRSGVYVGGAVDAFAQLPDPFDRNEVPRLDAACRDRVGASPASRRSGRDCKRGASSAASRFTSCPVSGSS